MSFPPVTEMFQFAGFALPSLCIQQGNTLSQLTPIPPRSEDQAGREINW
jgi:hypothetical protein